LILIGIGAWYYFSRVHVSQIGSILSNPKAYAGKEVTIEGEVTDRTSFFGEIKFYKVRDKTGEMIVVTRKTLPELKSVLRVKGKIDQAFPIGDLRLVVFLEESSEEKGSSK
jgi:aspartyl/asparaginyl-tRNA synthetase